MRGFILGMSNVSSDSSQQRSELWHAFVLPLPLQSYLQLRIG